MCRGDVKAALVEKDAAAKRLRQGIYEDTITTSARSPEYERVKLNGAWVWRKPDDPEVKRHTNLHISKAAGALVSVAVVSAIAKISVTRSVTRSLGMSRQTQIVPVADDLADDQPPLVIDPKVVVQQVVEQGGQKERVSEQLLRTIPREETSRTDAAAEPCDASAEPYDTSDASNTQVTTTASTATMTAIAATPVVKVKSKGKGVPKGINFSFPSLFSPSPTFDTFNLGKDDATDDKDDANCCSMSRPTSAGSTRESEEMREVEAIFKKPPEVETNEALVVV
jgi:hypothetical protein